MTKRSLITTVVPPDEAADELPERMRGIETSPALTGYPRQEGVFPHSQEWVDNQFAGIPENEVKHIVHDNTATVFGLSV